MIVVINTFHVAPAEQRKVIDLLLGVTRKLVSKAPGFLSSILHRGTDGTRVTMYARWESLESYEAMRQDPAPADALKELMTMARFDMAMFEVIEQFGAPD